MRPDPSIGYVLMGYPRVSETFIASEVLRVERAGVPLRLFVIKPVEERERSLAGLGSSHGVLQREIAAELRMKRTPTLEFVYDESIERGMRISELLEEDGPGAPR